MGTIIKVSIESVFTLFRLIFIPNVYYVRMIGDGEYRQFYRCGTYTIYQINYITTSNFKNF